MPKHGLGFTMWHRVHFVPRGSSASAMLGGRQAHDSSAGRFGFGLLTFSSTSGWSSGWLSFLFTFMGILLTKTCDSLLLVVLNGFWVGRWLGVWGSSWWIGWFRRWKSTRIPGMVGWPQQQAVNLTGMEKLHQHGTIVSIRFAFDKWTTWTKCASALLDLSIVNKCWRELRFHQR